MNPFLTFGVKIYTSVIVMSRKKTSVIDKSLFPYNINVLAERFGGKKAFSEQLGIAYDTVRRWCLGEFLPESNQLLIIREKFGVSIDWLLTGKEPRDTASMSQYAVNEEQTHDAGGAPHCPFCGDMTEETKELCKKVKEIIESKNIAFSTSLKTVITVFEQCKYKGKEKREPIRKLKQKILSFSK